MEGCTEIDLKDILKIIKFKRYSMIVITLLMILIGCVYTFVYVKPIYQSEVIIFINKADESIKNIISSDETINQVVSEMKDDDVDINVNRQIIKNGLQTSIDKTNKTITITMNSDNPDLANQTIEKIKEIIQPKLEETLNITSFQIIKENTIPEKPYNINHIKDLIFTLLIAIIIDFLYICICMASNKIYSTNEMKGIGLICLGKIKKNKAENNELELKKIMANIQFHAKIKNIKSILWIQQRDRNNTQISEILELADTLTKMDKKVLMIDSKNKEIQENLQINKVKQLIHIQKDSEKEKQCELANLATKVENKEFYLLETSDEKTENLLYNTKIEKTLKLLENTFDYVLILGEEWEKEATNLAWAHFVDATIIKAQFGKTKLKQIEKIKTEINQVGGKIAGVILTQVQS